MEHNSMEHGGDIFKIASLLKCNPGKIIDFSSNINFVKLPNRYKKIYQKSYSMISFYPDNAYEGLLDALSKYTDTEKKNIIIGNGASDLIYRFIGALKPEKTLVLLPTFSEYVNCLKKMNLHVDFFYLKESENFQLNKEELFKKIYSGYDLIVLCNPNNPTSTFLDEKVVLDIINNSKQGNSHILIDESFIEFTGKKIKYSFLMVENNSFKKIHILRSLTKLFGIPSLRVGYLLSYDTDLLMKLKNLIPPWNINLIAAKLTSELLSDRKFLDKSLKYNIKEREYLYKKLLKIKWIKTYEPFANFILLKIKNNFNSNDLYEYMLKYNILIRKCDNFNGLDDSYIRISVNTRKENKFLIKCFMNFGLNNNFVS